MIFEVASYRAKLLGAAGQRIVELLTETRVSNGYVSAAGEAEAASEVGLVKLNAGNCEPGLQESFSCCYFAEGTTAAEAMEMLARERGWRLDPSAGRVFSITAIKEIGHKWLAKKS